MRHVQIEFAKLNEYDLLMITNAFIDTRYPYQKPEAVYNNIFVLVLF